MPLPVSIVTVTYDGYFFNRLLVEKVREFIGSRDYEIIVVDRGSRDGTCEWLAAQPDVRLLHKRQWWRRHGHGEAAELGVRQAKHGAIVLLDSDAHPMAAHWLEGTVDRMDDYTRLAGPRLDVPHRGNPYKWFIHPYFMTFFKSDLGSRVILRKVRGNDTDTGEEATIRMLDANLGIIELTDEFCAPFNVGQPNVPSMSGGVFHAWFVTRLAKENAAVAIEQSGRITRENYLLPLQQLLRQAYHLDY